MKIQQAAKELAKQFEDQTWFQSIGIGKIGDIDVLYLYTNKKIPQGVPVPTVFQDYMVARKVVGKPRSNLFPKK